MGLLNMLLVLFIGLKLTDNIDWSWWLVLSPMILNILSVVALYSIDKIWKKVDPVGYQKMKVKYMVGDE